MTPEICEEATVLEPNDAEFKDFLTYVKKIKPIIEIYGICVVRPPSSWSPTFVMDLNKKLFSLEDDEDVNRFSIYEFGSMADDFKMNFFQQPVDEVNPGKLENKFWHLYLNNLMPSEVRKVTDLKMSGFASKNCPELLVEDKEYLNSTWNFNNTNSQCLLKYLPSSNYAKNNQVCTLGMCFSHQPWTIEEVFSSSLHFIHWGDSKTWYCIRRPSEELVHLLCSKQKVNKIQIMDQVKGQKVIKARQCAGDFVFISSGAATFSLSHGFNFSEKISYIPQDWFQQGHSYWKLLSSGKVQAFPFSLEELVFKYLRHLEESGSKVVEMLRELVTSMVEEEKRVRKSCRMKFSNLLEEQKVFELISEDMKFCNVCHKIIFLSSIFCHSCKKVFCPQCCLKASFCHDNICMENDPSTHTISLFWRYSDSELSEKIEKVVDRSENQRNWIRRANRMLGRIPKWRHLDDDNDDDGKMSLSELNQLKDESISLIIDDLSLMDEVCAVIREGEGIHKKLEILFCDNSQEPACGKPILSEVRSLLEDMKASRCRTNKLEAVEEVIKGIEDFITDVKELLSQCPLMSSKHSSHSNGDSQLSSHLRPPRSPKVMQMMMAMIDFKKAKALLAKSKKIFADVQEVGILEKYYERCDWIRNVQSGIEKLSTTMTMDGLQKLIGQGEQLCQEEGPLSEVTLEVLIFLQDYVKYFKGLDRAMKESLDSSSLKSMSDLKEFIEASKNFPKITFSNLTSIRKVLQDAQAWQAHVDVLLNGEMHPYLHNVKNHLLKGRGIPVKLERFDQLEKNVEAAEIWLNELSGIFLKNSNDDLIEVLAPRMNILEVRGCKKGLKKKRIQALLNLFTEDDESITIVDNALETSEATELEEMHIMRKVNGDKVLSDDSKYCFCRQPKISEMFECRLCKELFHESCLNSLNSNKENDPSSSSESSTITLHFLSHDQIRPTSSLQLKRRFLCPSCKRSKRPTMNQILSLLASSFKLSVRVAEARFLEAIGDRAGIWQKKVARFLRTEECSSAVNQLSIIAKEMKREYGLMTPQEISDSLAYQKICERAYADIGRPVPKPQAQNVDLPKDIFHKLEMMEVEGDLLEVNMRETLRLEEICIAYKLHLDRSKGEEEKIKPSTKTTALNSEDLTSLDIKNNKTNNTRKKKNKADDNEHSKKASKKPKLHHSKGDAPAKIRFYPLFKTKKDNGRVVNPSGNRNIFDDDDDDDDNDDFMVLPIKKDTSFDADEGNDNDHIEGHESGRGDVGGSSKDEDMEDCSAGVCLKPMGKEVIWVQCDRCSGWFHLQCIGLNIKDISEEEEFECSFCMYNRQCRRL